MEYGFSVIFEYNRSYEIVMYFYRYMIHFFRLGKTHYFDIYDIRKHYSGNNQDKYSYRHKIGYRQLTRYLFKKLRIKKLDKVIYTQIRIYIDLSYYVINLENLNKYKEQ